MRSVALMGKGKLACDIGSWFLDHGRKHGYELEAVVPVVPEPTWTDSLTDWCETRRIDYIKSGDYEELERADIVLSVYYDKILNKEFIDRFDKVLNIHSAPLPKYRGVSPINWALKNNEKSHGITMHEITPGIDDGPIVAQLNFSIYPEFDEVIDVYNRTIQYGYTLFCQTMPILDEITPISQDNSEATYYGKKDNEKLEERRNFTKELSA